MKPRMALFGLMICAGLAAVVLNPSLWQPLAFTIKSVSCWNHFLTRLKPDIKIGFSALYGSSGQFEVLHPLLAFPSLHTKSDSSCENLPAEQLAQEHIACEALIAPVLFASQSSKQRALMKFLRDGAALPKNFISTPPFIDPGGFSYAYLMTMKEYRPYNERDWVARHLSFYKASELHDVRQNTTLRIRTFAIIARLTPDEIKEVVKGSRAILSSDLLLVRDQSRLGFSPLSYWVFDRRKVHTPCEGEVRYRRRCR